MADRDFQDPDCGVATAEWRSHRGRDRRELARQIIAASIARLRSTPSRSILPAVMLDPGASFATDDGSVTPGAKRLTAHVTPWVQ
jgi:hypothetical protein